MKDIKKTGVVFALIRDEKILMQQRDEDSKRFPGMWCIPGGGSEDGESYEATLLREIKEEYDLNINIEDCTYFMDHDGEKSKKVYLCKVDKNQEPKLQEGLAMKWMSIDEIEKLNLGFNQKEIVAKLKLLLI